ncbi:MAG: pirin family protein [Janthinobacterium lividum]
MITHRKAADRGPTKIAWLDSRHSFSFGDYNDRAHMGFGALRVINEDRVVPGAGFGTHAHADMEILSYVIDGALSHKDSIGTGSTIRPGELQRMTAGTGIRHSEQNASATDPVHFLQIWVVPERRGLEPGYEQVALPAAGEGSGLDLIGSRDGRDGSVTIHQDVLLYRALPRAGVPVGHAIAPGRRLWVQVVRGEATVNGLGVAAGDGVALTDEAALAITGDDAELLVFDLA